MITYALAFLCRLGLITATGLLAVAGVTLGLKCPPVGLGLLVLLVWKRWRWQGSGSSHGTAYFADMVTFLRHGLLGERGLFIGDGGYAEAPSRSQALRLLLSPTVSSRTACLLFLSAWAGSGWGRQLVVRIPKPVHLAAFAATGRGKGIYVVNTTILSHRGSMVIVDGKDGELFKLTAKARRRFGPVIRLDGFGLFGPGSAKLNLFAFLDPRADDFLDRCRDFANMIMVREGKAVDVTAYFLDMAEIFLGNTIAFVACDPDPANRNLQTVRDILASPDRFRTVIDRMTQIPFLQRQGHLMRWPKERELGSIMGTLTRMMSWLDGPAMAEHTTGTQSFDPAVLRRKPCTTVYICAESGCTNAVPLLRLTLGLTLRRLAEKGGDASKPVLVLIDEAGNLGQINALDHAVTTVRSAGINLFFIWQSIGQVKEHYGERAATILENIDTKIYFGINEFESAEAISRELGDQTRLVDSYNETTQRSRPEGPLKDQQGGSVSTSTSYTASEIGRALLRPDEILRLPDDFAIVRHRNLPALPVRLARYFDSHLFKCGRAGRARGLGLAAVLATLTAVAAGLFAAGFALSLPVADAPRQYDAYRRPAAGAPGWPQVDMPPVYGPYAPPVQPWRPARPIPRGRLIRIP